MYRRGNEIEAFSHAQLHQLNKKTQDITTPEVNVDLHKSVCADVSRRIHTIVSTIVTDTSFDLNNFIKQADPVVWETISILTSEN